MATYLKDLQAAQQAAHLPPKEDPRVFLEQLVRDSQERETRAIESATQAEIKLTRILEYARQGGFNNSVGANVVFLENLIFASKIVPFPNVVVIDSLNIIHDGRHYEDVHTECANCGAIPCRRCGAKTLKGAVCSVCRMHEQLQAVVAVRDPSLFEDNSYPGWIKKIQESVFVPCEFCGTGTDYGPICRLCEKKGKDPSTPIIQF
jgi:hypothetical protein